MKAAKKNRWTRPSLWLSLSGVVVLGLFLLEPAAAQSRADKVIYLDQAWSQADREMFSRQDRGKKQRESFRRFSITAASSGTAGQEHWRIWE